MLQVRASMQPAGWVALAMVSVVWPACADRAQEAGAPGLPAAAGWVIEWTRDGRILLAGSGVVAMIDLETGAETVLDELALTAAVAPSGKRVALAHGDEIELRSLPGNKVVGRLAARQVLALAWSPDEGTLAGGTEDGHVLLWEIAGPRTESVAVEQWADLEVAPPSAVTRVAFVPKGRLVSVYADGRAVVWDLEERADVQRIDLAHDAAGKVLREASVVAVAPDGRVLGTQIEAGRAEVVLLDEKSRTVWRRPGTGLEFSPDGSHALALDADGRAAVLLAVADGTLVRRFDPPAGAGRIYFARLDAEGKRLAAVGEDAGGQVLIVWDVASGQLVKTHR